MPTERKAHVKRITSDDDDGVWVDILRLDEAELIRHHGAQREFLKLRWEDIDNDTDNTLRGIETIDVKVGGDDAKTVPVKVIKEMTTIRQATGQKTRWHFKNHRDTNTSRNYFPKRVIHTNTGIDPTTPVPWATYLGLLQSGETNSDDGNYCDTEIPHRFRTKAWQAGPYQGTTGLLKPSKPISLLPCFTDDYEEDDLTRLDPFQIIVNVKGGGDDSEVGPVYDGQAIGRIEVGPTTAATPTILLAGDFAIDNGPFHHIQYPPDTSGQRDGIFSGAPETIIAEFPWDGDSPSIFFGGLTFSLSISGETRTWNYSGLTFTVVGSVMPNGLPFPPFVASHIESVGVSGLGSTTDPRIYLPIIRMVIAF